MDLAGLCLEYVNEQSSADAPKLIAKAISDGGVELVKVVEALELYLTSTNIDNRSAGTRLLSEVLTQLPPGSLNADEVHYIIAFYCDRLKDKVVIIPHVLSGIHTLVTQYALEDNDVVAVCRTIFKEVYNQSQQFPERRLVYAIVGHFLTHQLHAVQLMSSDFVLGYIQAIDGERDPRNLLMVFNSVEQIIHHIQFETLAEDLFDVTACYFPIDFTPPSNDPTTVTKESLVVALRKCLTATEKFAEFCLPLLLDKLTSDLTSAKLDSLLTLAAGACAFGASKLHPFLQPFWTAIKREMYMTADNHIQVACIEALTALTKALSQPLQVSSSESTLDSFIAMVLQDCRRHLSEPQLRLATPTIHLLRGIAVSSDPAWTCLAASILPLLIQQANLETQATKQRVVLEALLVFISAVRQTDDGEVSPPLLSNRDALLELLMSAITHKDSSIRVVAISTLGVLLKIKGALERSKVMEVSERLKEVALSDEDHSVREASCQSLAQLASVDEGAVKDHLIPSLLSLLSDSSGASIQLVHVVNLLSSLSMVCPSLMKIILPPLVDQFGRLLNSDIPLASSVASVLVSITNSCLSWEEFQRLLADGLLRKMVAACVMSCDVTTPVLEDVVTILSFYTQTVEESLSQNLLSWLVRVLVNGEEPASEVTSLLPPMGVAAPPTQSQLVALLSGVVGAAPKEVVVHFSNHLLPIMKGMSLNCEHPLTQRYTTQCYASLLNKLPQGEALSCLEQELDELWGALIGGGPTSSRERVLNLWVWMSKALLVRGHPKGMEAAVKLLSLCGSDKDLGAGAADGFAVLMADNEHLLNLKCHCNIRLFYKQQLFSQVVPQLVELFKGAQSADFRRDDLLRALSHLMQGVPKEVLLTELPTVLPLLLESMRSEDVSLKLSSLTAVHSLISDAPQSVEEHVPALVPRLLQLARDPTSMKVRRESLSCVRDLTSLPTHIVYPYQSTVVQQLASCLDDHKRLVRKEAVDARSKWYLLGTEL